MTTTPKALVQAKFLETAETNQYISTDCKTAIDKASVTNVTAANAVVSLSIVQSGGTPGTSNRITFTKSIAPKVTYTFPELIGQVMESGDFISTLAGTASALVLRISGRQFT